MSLFFRKQSWSKEDGKGLEKKLLHIVGYNKNSESESVKQDGELMNASEIVQVLPIGKRSRNLSTINRQGKQEMSGQHRAEKSEEEDGREKNYEKAIFR
ncbi:hypothetical protein YC2023_122525 [Brassica napus]